MLHETFEAGIEDPDGGVKLLATALTLILKASLLKSFALVKETVNGFGLPVVDTLTFVTANDTNAGTVTLTVGVGAAAASDPSARTATTNRQSFKAVAAILTTSFLQWLKLDRLLTPDEQELNARRGRIGLQLRRDLIR